MRSSKQPRLRKRARLDIIVIISFVSCALLYFEFGDLSLDGRSLGVARILLGGLVLLDILTSRWPLRHLLYSDGPLSVWPREVVFYDPQIQSTDLSIYMMSGSVRWTECSFIVSGIAACMLSLGMCTQLSCAVCWVHVKSLSARTSAVQQAGDTLFRILLFWFIWLPCSDHFSWDAQMGSRTGTYSNTGVTVASAAFLIQMALLYQLPAAFKVNDLWNSPNDTESAIYYVLANVAFRRTNLLTTWLLEHPELTSVLTRVTPFLEHAAPIFIFGSKIPGLRLFGVTSLIGFHLGLHVCMTLRLFPWICVAGWVALLPSAFWEWCVPHTASGPVLQGAQGGNESWIYDSFSLVVCVLALCSTLQACFDSLPLPEALARGISTHVSGLHALSRIGRLLGMHQQWFLFDNPAKSSYWYRIKGRTTSGGERAGVEYDLHKLLRYHCNGPSLSSSTLADQIALDPQKEKNVEENFDECYGGALWRKFYQNLGQAFNGKTEPRYAAFVPHYAKALRSLWSQSGLRDQLGDLQEVKCVAYWHDTSPAARKEGPIVVNSALMWKV